MRKFSVEEMTLLNVYVDRSKQATLENIIAALPYMDTEMQKLAQRTMKKMKALTKEEFAELVDCDEYEA